MEPFAAVPEQHEAKRLLAAALDDGDAHAFLFHGPAGVGKTTAAFAFAGAQLGDARRVAERTHPDLRVVEPLGDMIRIDVDPGAPSRPPPAPVRGRPPCLPPPRGASAQRRCRRRAAEGSRGAAALRHDRAGRRRARAASRDDPLALPARPLPAALGARGARVADDSGAGAGRSGGDGDRAGRGRPPRPRPDG